MFFCTIIVWRWETSLGPGKHTLLRKGEIFHYLVKKNIHYNWRLTSKALSVDEIFI